MESIERAGERLHNIHTVEPILGALRTISLGSWQAVLAQRGQVAAFGRHLQTVLTALRPQLQPAGQPGRPGPPRRVLLLAVGSERGLCGRFNATILERMEGYLEEAAAAGRQVELALLGTRLVRAGRRAGPSPAYTGGLAVTSLPPFELAVTLTREWLERYEARALDAVDVIYNAYRQTGAGAGYTTTVARLLPPRLPAPEPGARAVWPPPVIETDPLRLYTRLAGQWATLQLYARLLDSAAAEHATRYQLMEAAARNADQLIDELTLEIQSARQQAITREMQELAAGAGLVGRQRHTP